MTQAAAGMDLAANLPPETRKKGIKIPAGKWRLVQTGLEIALPAGFEAQIRPRSGLAMKYGVTVLNAPGTIDADYRGEIGVLLINLGDEEFSIAHGDRVAQLVIQKVYRARLSIAKTLPASKRGSRGFGSTNPFDK
jgi:dUTP pyrophosphatase